jgi:hypothetical protein
MNTRSQWSSGLQWGACAWLGYLTWTACAYVVCSALERSLASTFAVGDVLDLLTWPIAVLYLVLLALVAAGSRWARPVAALTILGRIALGFAEGRHYGGVPSFAFTMRFAMPALPLLPLALLRVEAPRVVLALLAHRRWREAALRFGGAVPVLVAAGVVSLNHAGWMLSGRLHELRCSVADLLVELVTGWTAPLCVFAAAMAVGTLATMRRESRAT